MKKKIVIATRKSPLALWQAEYVKTALLSVHPALQVDLLMMTTQGDIYLDTPLSTKGGKGLFVKELEYALLDGRADIAVHSMKDISVEFPPGLRLGCMVKRADPRDVFISPHFENLKALPEGAKIGTASLRRQFQLKLMRPDLDVQPVRGNIATRLNKLATENFSGIILAAAGIQRLNLETHIRHYFSLEEMLPAVGQGVIGIECRQEDIVISELIAPLNDLITQHCVMAERAFNCALGGGCQVPIAAYATIQENELILKGMIGRPDGSEMIQGEVSGSLDTAEKMGRRLAEDFIAEGAKEILSDIYS